VSGVRTDGGFIVQVSASTVFTDTRHLTPETLKLSDTDTRLNKMKYIKSLTTGTITTTALIMVFFSSTEALAGWPSFSFHQPMLWPAGAIIRAGTWAPA
jgi:hypothetical protein